MQTLTLNDGLRLLAQKKFKQVHADCILAIKADVKNAPAYFLLGVLAADHDNHDKAIELFTIAESYNAIEPYYPAYLAKILSITRRQNEAKAAADRATAMVGDDPLLLDTIAVVYSRCGFHEAAIPLFKRAIELQKALPNMHYNLGASAQFVGDFELADHAYNAALELDPNFYRAWASLVYLSKQSESDNSLQRLMKLFSQNSENSDAELQLGHAIAKTFEDIGDFNSSFSWLLRAKRSKRNELRYDRTSGEATFNAARHTYPDTTNEQILQADTATEVIPVFVIGLPRTGTTLVDRIISSHSQVTSVGELNTFAELIKDGSDSSSNLVLDAQTLSNSDGLDFAQIGHDYLRKTSELARGNTFMLDKMPLNFFYAGLIHKALPNARIIVLRRGALDSCLSNFRQLFSTQYSFYNYTFDLSDTAWFYRQFDALMAHWERVLPPASFLQVNYEDIVYQQEAQTRRMLDFCGLAWEESCMSFHENTAPVSTASSVQVRQPIYSGSIGRWQKYGDKIDDLRVDLDDLAEN